MTDNADENYRQIIGHAFGQQEAMMGPEAYNSMVEVNRSIAEANRKSTELAVLQQENATNVSKSIALHNIQHASMYGAIGTFFNALAFIAIVLGISLAVRMWL